MQDLSLEPPAYLALAPLLPVPFTWDPSSRVSSRLLCRDQCSDTGGPAASWQPGAGLRNQRIRG